MAEKKKLYKVNAVFLGESGVGKTSIIRRLLGQEFDEDVKATLGITSNSIPNIKFQNEEEDNSEVEIQIWDTAGQEKYRSVSKIILQKADIIIFVRDNHSNNLEYWFKFVEDIIDIEAKKVFYCLNKTDLMSENEKKSIVNELKMLKRQNKHHAIIHCVSSKNSDGIINLQSSLEEKSQEKVSNDLKRYKYTINILLIGDMGVGKSSLIERIINNSFRKNNTSTTVVQSNFTKVDLKNHSSIMYNYIDSPGQEKYRACWIHLVEKADIIILVNNKEELKSKTDLIEERILLSDVKIICCINKNDLFSDGEKEKIIKIYKEKNEKLKDKHIIFVSAKTADGIDDLKKKIKEYSIDIVDKKINKSQNENAPLDLEVAKEKKKECC